MSLIDPITIRLATNSDRKVWDSYVQSHACGIVYHLYGWKNVIEKAYGHKTYYFMAYKNRSQLPAFGPQPSQFFDHLDRQPDPAGYELYSESHELDRDSDSDRPAITHELHPKQLLGILPLVHLRHFLFGNSLISLPFFDLGGILANDEESEKALLSGAIALGRKLEVDNIELRHSEPLVWFVNSAQPTVHSSTIFPVSHELLPMGCKTKSHKVRMLLDLPESSQLLWKSFKSNLRRKIRKPLKEGMSVKMGGHELLNDFYRVFVANMRDLGSPVHSKRLMRNVLKEFPENSKIVVIYKGKEPIASSLCSFYKDVFGNPWVSALRKHRRHYPNLLLYWSMLEYACDNGYSYFDFGRSSPDGGTYIFKEQWGARPYTLYWHYVNLKNDSAHLGSSKSSKYDKAVEYWKKLPIFITKIVGPMIRKYIGL